MAINGNHCFLVHGSHRGKCKPVTPEVGQSKQWYVVKRMGPNIVPRDELVQGCIGKGEATPPTPTYRAPNLCPASVSHDGKCQLQRHL